VIESILSVVPKNIVPRVYSEELVRFEQSTGLKITRRFEGTMSDFLLSALAQYKGQKDVNNVVLVTQTPDRLSPCMAMDVVRFLRLSPETLAFDVNHACDGWVLGVHLANRLGGKTSCWSVLICLDMHQIPSKDISLVTPFLSHCRYKRSNDFK